jgi:cellulose synthase/poly-beta-1,6-N-acetylglucosamine synthase-like glycosyltransferase
VHDVEACTGAFLLIRRAAFVAVDGWDEAYRFYGDDLDLCARVRAAGYRVRYVGTERAVHVKGASSHLHESGEIVLSPSQRRTRSASARAVVDSHERYYELHMQARTVRPLRPLIRTMFALQRRWASRR